MHNVLGSDVHALLHLYHQKKKLYTNASKFHKYLVSSVWIVTILKEPESTSLFNR